MMKVLITVLVFSVAFANSSSIRPLQPKESEEEIPFPEDLLAESSEEDSSYEARSLLTTFKNAASLVSNARSNSLSTNLKTAAGVVADVALTAATGTETGAALAKKAVGVAGAGIVAASSALGKSSLANNTLAQALLNGTSSVGGLLSEYGNGNETVSTVVSLVESVTSGNMTIQKALVSAGAALADNALTPTKEKIAAAGTTLEVIGGVVETLGASMKDNANSTTADVLTNIISTLKVDSLLKASFSTIDSALNITVEDIISSKLEELDASTSTIKEKIVAVGEVLVAVGSTINSIGESATDLGDSSVVNYASIIKEALEELTSSSSS